MSGGPAGTLLSVLMLVAALLVYGGVWLLRRGERGKGVLMLACAAVMVGNVAIWTV